MSNSLEYRMHCHVYSSSTTRPSCCMPNFSQCFQKAFRKITPNQQALFLEHICAITLDIPTVLLIPFSRSLTTLKLCYQPAQPIVSSTYHHCHIPWSRLCHASINLHCKNHLMRCGHIEEASAFKRHFADNKITPNQHALSLELISAITLNIPIVSSDTV